MHGASAARGTAAATSTGDGSGFSAQLYTRATMSG